MKGKVSYMWAIIAGLLVCGEVPGQTTIGTAFTYQGQLKQNGRPVNDTCAFRFGLWDAATGGNQVGDFQTISNVQVVNGLFATKIDFGKGVLDGNARWLEIAASCPFRACNGGPNDRQPCTSDADCIGALCIANEISLLNPRVELTPTPHAQFAAVAAGVLTGDSDFDPIQADDCNAKVKIYKNDTPGNRTVTVKVRNKDDCEIRIVLNGNADISKTWRRGESFSRDIVVPAGWILELECADLDGNDGKCKGEWKTSSGS